MRICKNNFYFAFTFASLVLAAAFLLIFRDSLLVSGGASALFYCSYVLSYSSVRQLRRKSFWVIILFICKFSLLFAGFYYLIEEVPRNKSYIIFIEFTSYLFLFLGFVAKHR